MLYLLDKSDYPKVKHLVRTKEEKSDVPLNAVINGTNVGNIYVDDPDHPKAALVDAVGTTCFLIGDASSPVFGEHLKDCIENQLKDQCLESGGSYFIATLFDKEWEKVLENAISHREYEPDYEFYHEFDKDKFNKVKSNYRSLTNEYTIKRMDRELIQNDSDDTLRSCLSDFWDSIDDFLTKGVGFCVIKDEQVISSCFTCYVDGNNHEISVETYDEEEQNKGLATKACEVYLEYCIENGITPHWSTFETNVESVNLASKLGFEYRFKLKTYEFEY
ncbi:GNAT family N-acetyltransferase [Paenibacillus larvae]|uniref:GNAT family N-acetyltransferase n=1 Tax=Paenibacillus larvae TaxID=1464 RepID=UPI002281A1B5|nr:GNAT family N-acetyltransferase [Paenibacillus larvae]MCY9509955.1 GNAT family N-acetyltransferase [Paenibacillus larvae]MCY9524792.1 GNAT family N-acetyltransferase [Paenibacillus larvae]